MKTAKKILALLLAVMLLTALSATALAVDSGKGGPATITITNAQDGSSYGVYKIFDATVSQDGTKIAYTLPSGKTAADITGNANANNWFAVDAANNVTAKAALTETVLKSAEFKTWATGFAGAAQWSGTAVKSGTGANMSGDFLVIENLPYGYYVVTTSTGNGVVTVDSTKPNARIIDKNSVPRWDNGPGEPGKVIVQGQNKVSVNEAKLDDPIAFDIGITAKNYDGADKIYKYEVTDTLDTCMTYVSEPLVKVGNTTLTKGTQYTLTWTGGSATMQTATGFTVEIPWTSDGTAAGDSLYADSAEIHVSYNGMLDSNKLTDSELTNNVKFGGANVNTADYSWYKGSLTTPTGTGVTKKTDTYSTQLQITKTDGTNALTGAEFELTGPFGVTAITTGRRFVADPAGAYWKLKDGSYTTTDPNTAGVNRNAYESTTTRYLMNTYVETGPSGVNSTSGSVKAFVDGSGKLTFSGLVAGDYTLVESTVPPGYNKAPDISFTVSFNSAVTLGANEKRWTVSNIAPAGTTITDGDTLLVTVVNQAGQVLPSTGGVGTTIFYILGSVLLLGAAVLLITRKRMSREG